MNEKETTFTATELEKMVADYCDFAAQLLTGGSMTKRAIDGGFVQLYRDYMPMIRKLNMINPMAANVFLFLAENKDTSNEVACSSKVMEEAFGVCRISISKAVRDLRGLEFVQIHKWGQPMSTR